MLPPHSKDVGSQKWHGKNFSVQAREHSTTEKKRRREAKLSRILGRCAQARP